tara:strand:+ start:79 stop:408 length:330 start_codon:yes stop_codon:yes gene_type:complete
MPVYKYYPSSESEEEDFSDCEYPYNQLNTSFNEINTFFEEHIGPIPSGAIQSLWIRSNRDYKSTMKQIGNSKLRNGICKNTLLSAANIFSRLYGGKTISIYSEMLIYYS